jgi:hypothetical protein
MTAGLVTGYQLRYAWLRRHTVNQAVSFQQGNMTIRAQIFYI